MGNFCRCPDYWDCGDKFFLGLHNNTGRRKKIEREIVNASAKNLSGSMSIPSDFDKFWKTVDGVSNWDNAGFRQSTLADTSDKNLIVMEFLCKKFN